MEVGEETARAICSGNGEGTLLASLGWSIGRSSLPLRSDRSKRRVSGLKGPSRVVGTWWRPFSCLLAPSATLSPATGPGKTNRKRSSTERRKIFTAMGIVLLLISINSRIPAVLFFPSEEPRK